MDMATMKTDVYLAMQHNTSVSPTVPTTLQTFFTVTRSVKHECARGTRETSNVETRGVSSQGSMSVDLKLWHLPQFFPSICQRRRLPLGLGSHAARGLRSTEPAPLPQSLLRTLRQVG